MENEKIFKVGDYATVKAVPVKKTVHFESGIESENHLKDQQEITLTGIVYETESLRIQTADGTKVRYLSHAIVVPATEEAIEQYQSEAIEGMNPEAIIAREEAEKSGHSVSKGNMFDDDNDDDDLDGNTDDD